MTSAVYGYIALAAAAVFVFAWEVVALLQRVQDSLKFKEEAVSGAGGGPQEVSQQDIATMTGLLPGDLLRIKVVTASLLGILGLVLIFIQYRHASDFGFILLILGVLLGGLVFYVSFVVPNAILRFLYERRMQTMNRQLVDAMGVLSLALRSGKTFESALPLVAHEVSPPLGTEFNRVVQEIGVGGASIEEAMQRMAERIPFKDMQIFVSTMLIVQGIGGSQADILDRSAELIRQRFILMQKCKAMTAEGRFTALAISLAPVFILGVNFIINYDMTMAFVTHPVGVLVMTAIAISDFIGYKILTALTKSEV